jgi:BirA family biotin operon repressor/biotin-[acetyl-CoA-carboxylase] ligase
VLGIGLNVATTHDELSPQLRDSATSLQIAAGADVAREAVLEALLERLSDRLGSGRDELLTTYRERDALYGRNISWQSGDHALEGNASGIDEAGNLVVFLPRGERVALTAGEVHLLPMDVAPPIA